jgi:alpha-beta hydrolase superfamily lysophospholipase
LSYREQITTATDSTPVFVRRWEIPDPHSVVLVVHGYADHGGRYSGLARTLNKAGCTAVAYDQRGNGRSGGDPGRVSSYRDFVADLDRIVAMVFGDYGLPIDLFAHSFGGVQAALYCTDAATPSVRSVVLSSPAFRVVASALLQPLAGILARVAPRLQTPAIDRAVISRDTDVVRAAESDPLVYNDRVEAHTAAELIRAGRQALSSAPRFQLPLLAFHGSADKLTDPAATESFVDRAASPSKSFHLLDGLYHETFNEPEKDTVYSLVVSFLDGLARG